jgi:hypothetical protein
MSQHKAVSTSFDKEAYWKRRNEGLRGQPESTTAVKTGSRLSRGKHSEKRATLRQNWRAYNRQLRKGSARGE